MARNIFIVDAEWPGGESTTRKRLRWQGAKNQPVRRVGQSNRIHGQGPASENVHSELSDHEAFTTLLMTGQSLVA